MIDGEELTDADKVFLDEIWTEVIAQQSEPIEDETDGDEDFAGTGLLITENGELAIVICDGGLETVQIFRTSETEVRALGAMIDAVLG